MDITVIRVTFDPDDSEFQFALAGDYPSGVEWFINIEGPFGTIKAQDFDNPDAVGAVTTLSIPSADPIQEGEYIFTVTAWQAALPGFTRPPKDQLTHTVCYEPKQKFKLSVSDDCVDLKIRDITEYPLLYDEDTFSRLITVGYPFIDCINTPPDETYDTPSVTFSMAQPDGKTYEHVTWQVRGTSGGEFLFESGVWQIIYEITYQEGAVDHYVQCSLDLCAAVECVDEHWSRLIGEACDSGGIAKLSAAEQGKIQTLLGHLAMYAHYVNCNDRENAVRYYNLIKEAATPSCTIEESPSVIKNPVPGQRVWYPVLSEEFGDGFDTVTGDELMASVTNGMLVFKGSFNGGPYPSGGTELIKQAFFERIGISFTNTNTGIVLYAAAGPSLMAVAKVYPDNGSMFIVPSADPFDTTEDFLIQGTFAIGIA